MSEPYDEDKEKRYALAKFLIDNQYNSTTVNEALNDVTLYHVLAQDVPRYMFYSQDVWWKSPLTGKMMFLDDVEDEQLDDLLDYLDRNFYTYLDQLHKRAQERGVPEDILQKMASDLRSFENDHDAWEENLYSQPLVAYVKGRIARRDHPSQGADVIVIDFQGNNKV